MMKYHENNAEVPQVITGMSKFFGGNIWNLYKWIFNYAGRLLTEKDILEIFPYIREEGKLGGKHLKHHYFSRIA